MGLRQSLWLGGMSAPRRSFASGPVNQKNRSPITYYRVKLRRFVRGMGAPRQLRTAEVHGMLDCNSGLHRNRTAGDDIPVHGPGNGMASGPGGRIAQHLWEDRIMFRLATVGTVALPLVFSSPVGAVEYMSADVHIREITASIAGDSFTCAATILTNGAGDDSARDVTLVIVLPLEVKVRDKSPACVAVEITGGTGTWASHVICKWASLTRHSPQSVKIITTKSRHPRSKSCGALIWNSVPDPNPANNSRSATAP